MSSLSAPSHGPASTPPLARLAKLARAVKYRGTDRRGRQLQRKRQRVNSLPPSLILDGLGSGLEESIKEGLEMHSKEGSIGLLKLPNMRLDSYAISHGNHVGHASHTNHTNNTSKSKHPVRTSATTNTTSNTANTMLESTTLSASTLTADSSIIKLVDFAGVDEDLKLFTKGQSHSSPNVLLFRDVADEIHNARLTHHSQGRSGVAESHYASCGTCSEPESGCDEAVLGDGFGMNTILRRDTVKAMYGVDAA
ncbi:hypothetical protein E3P89_03772 [Wallemia ichthyophaga]|uniref:Uncharacterized protein n=1 Tax=Wallemia ichthyophaga TaxID=245174 RepID=A0A4T0HTF4_WALIC|nr:hypothetical protein E3P90_03798 [Wallemia ichthyophaga]TIB19668.1 hypothetical protein E3P89_03772 [Wallemia ichthyophaga]TIB20789.1 hypothetical protein E3P88_03784 [Wallemia ichthyophaga]